MKRKRFFMAIIFIVLIIAVGCNNANLIFSEENLNNANMKVESFLNSFKSKNGIYLYEGDKDEKYLFLNGYNVIQGEKASYFTDVKMEVKERTMVINFNEKYTDDYKNKEIKNRILYKIKHLKNVDTIKIYRNGQETHFDSIKVSE